MCPMFVTECFHNKCLNCQPCVQFIFSPRCESDMILSVMTLGKMLDQQIKEMRRGSKDRDSRDNRDSRDSRDRRDSRDSRDNRDSRNSRDSRRSYRSDSDSASEDDRCRSRSRDSSRSRFGSRGRTIKNCTYCHKPNHDWSHCYRYPKDIKKVCSGNLRIDDSRDKDEQARWQMLIDLKNYIESEKDSTN